VNLKDGLEPPFCSAAGLWKAARVQARWNVLAVSDSVGWLCGASLSLPSPSVAVTFQAAIMRQGFGSTATRPPGLPGTRPPRTR